MSNPARSKGTAFENEVLVALQEIWPDADRAKPGNKSNDFVGVPFPVEAKHRKQWDIRDWVRKIRLVAVDMDVDYQWAIVAADGDRRLAMSPGTVAIVDAEFLYELLEAWNMLGVPEELADE